MRPALKTADGASRLVVEIATGKRFTRRTRPRGHPGGAQRAASRGPRLFGVTTGDVSHVGIFAGGADFVHAPHTGDVVSVSSLDEPYYAGEFAGARHIAD